ncbi:hypothetical protein, partial [Pseudomonas syringae group genomosp. 7]|uniref:hypothetical protein n=1 Tax=Pseudomonas syringae group genomosp. 7 TaxID=251699 RepID=UPI00376FA25A
NTPTPQVSSPPNDLPQEKKSSKNKLKRLKKIITQTNRSSIKTQSTNKPSFTKPHLTYQPNTKRN